MLSIDVDEIMSSLSMWKETYKKCTSKMNILFILILYFFIIISSATYCNASLKQLSLWMLKLNWAYYVMFLLTFEIHE
jgi:hypothetical protein